MKGAADSKTQNPNAAGQNSTSGSATQSQSGANIQSQAGAKLTSHQQTTIQQSVLSAVTDSRTDLMKRVGAADRARLDEYFTSVRELEQTMAAELQKPTVQPDLGIHCDARVFLEELDRQLQGGDAKIDAYYFCPHSEDHEDRKPDYEEVDRHLDQVPVTDDERRPEPMAQKRSNSNTSR